MLRIDDLVSQCVVACDEALSEVVGARLGDASPSQKHPERSKPSRHRHCWYADIMAEYRRREAAVELQELGCVDAEQLVQWATRELDPRFYLTSMSSPLGCQSA
jgi:hypothetical protein